VKALVKTQAQPGLELMDVPVPNAGPNDVLIRVARTGICGTDLHILNWDGWAAANVSVPIIVGHELCGEIVEVGSAVEDLEVGMFCSVEGHQVCGRCRSCLADKRHLCAQTKALGVHIDGAFAEYLSTPAQNVWVHRTAIDPDVAAIFDPFGNAVHAALQFPCLGEDVLVSGAGPIGTMAALVTRHAGARNVVITDLSDARLDLARSLGIDVAINVTRETLADAQQQLGMCEGFDVGLEMSGSGAALADMIVNMTHGGRIAMLGIPPSEIQLDMAKVVLNMLTIQGVYGRKIFETWYAMSVLVQCGLDISGVITHRFHYSDHQEAFAAAGGGAAGKVLLEWTDHVLLDSNGGKR